MNTSTRNLIVVAACIVVLGGAAAALALTGKGADTASSAASAASIDLVSKKSEDIVSMSVKNKKGSYTLIPVQTAASSAASGSSSSGSTVTYTLQGRDGVPIDSAAAGQVIQNGFNLVATKNLGKIDNLEEFGLKDPQATVKVSFKDGSTYNYKIGSPSATDSSSYYMCGENSNNVYVVSVDGGILDNENYFISKNILAITDSSGQNDFTKITLSGKNFPQPISIAKMGTVQAIISPFSAEADDTKLSAMQTALATVTASSVEAIRPDAAALKTYGFDQPTAVAEFTVNKGSYKLIVGAKKDSSYYVMMDKGNVVYSVSADSISAWAEATAFSVRSKSLLMPNISDVKSITVTQGSASSALNIARTKDEAKSTQDKPAYTYKVTGTGGKELAYDTNYKNFYKSLISIQLLEAAGGKPSGTPAYSVEYQYYDKGGKDTIQLYKSGDRRYTAVVNGQVYGTVTSTDVDKMTSSYQQLQNGQSVAG